jgi:Secretion system C-terminal sorting domain
VVAGIYTATGTERYITIGNFEPDSTLQTVLVNTLTGIRLYWYLIDDVFVYEAKAFAGRDTILTQGQSVWVGLDTIPGLVCQWWANGIQLSQTGGGFWATPTTNTTYIVQTTVCGQTTRDTMQVQVWPLGINPITPSAISLYPNPSTGQVSISVAANNSTDWQYSIMAIDGKQVQAASSINQTTTIQLPKGLYILKFKNQQHETIYKKLAVQ